MKYSRFEDLPVWQAAIDLAAQTYKLTSHAAWQGHSSLRDQLERAAVSVSNNIAEGFERGTNQELQSSLYIAKGSAGEVRSMLHLLMRLEGFASVRADVTSLQGSSESVSKQLGAWLASLKNSDYKGQKFANERAKTRERVRKDREEFVRELRQAQEANIVSSRIAGSQAPDRQTLNDSEDEGADQ